MVGNRVVAADRICAAHLKSVMTWLEQPRTGAAVLTAYGAFHQSSESPSRS